MTKPIQQPKPSGAGWSVTAVSGKDEMYITLVLNTANQPF